MATVTEQGTSLIFSATPLLLQGRAGQKKACDGLWNHFVAFYRVHFNVI
jgi:hypothetical protein